MRLKERKDGNKQMQIIAHRGFCGEYPENTMLAYEMAKEAGCDGIELDVQLTKDQVMVLIHDESIDRTSNGKGFVKDYTYEELLRFDFSAGFMGRYGVNKIPTMNEYLDWVQGINVFTNIELKNSVCYYADLEDMVIEAVRQRKLENRVLLSSFNNVSILKCKRLMPEVKTAFLTETPIWNAGRYVSENQVDCFHPDLTWLTREEVNNCKEYGVKVNVWTVNTKEDMQKMKVFGVDGIFTNYPNKFQDLK